MAIKRLVKISALLFCSFSAEAGIVRGPYLQRASHSEITVCWRTDTACIGSVRYGTSETNLTLTAAEPTSGTNHTVRLTGLAPDTTYYYQIGCGTNEYTGGAAWFFQTFPEPGSIDPVRIWVLGDSGKADANAASVYSGFQSFNGDQYVDLMLMLGDNAYYSGTDAEYQRAVFDMYPAMLRQTPWFSCYGNHDGYSADSATQTGPYYDIFTLPSGGECGGVPSGTEAYYSFDCGNAHFVCLDSFESSMDISGAMYAWLEQDLASNTSDWLIAFWHHPPYSKGSRDSDVDGGSIQIRQTFLPLLEHYGVDLVLSGHSHIYERSVLASGHHGHSSSYDHGLHTVNGGDGYEFGDGMYEKALNGIYAGIGSVYMVAGSSGWLGGTSPGFPHPVMHQYQRRLGSVILEIEGPRLDAFFFSTGGNTRDAFSIVKLPVPTGDLDGDGMPDEWEQFRFSDPTNALPDGDADGDGLSNLSEYIVGSHPHYSQSSFRAGTSVLNGNVVIHWPSVSGREYDLWQAASMVSNDWNLVAGDLPATPPANSNVVDTADAEGYFRVNARFAD